MNTSLSVREHQANSHSKCGWAWFTDSVIELISKEKEKGWEFLFLGANIDAVETAGHFGIAPERAVNYCSDPEGTALNYEVLSQAVSAVREARPLTASWKSRIERDFKKRRK